MNDELATDATFYSAGDDNRRVKVKYRVGDKELEIEGPSEEVNQHTAFFFSKVVGLSSSVEPSVDLITDRTNDSTAVSKAVAHSPEREATESPAQVQSSAPEITLVDFYRQKSGLAELEQKVQVLVITYFYHHFLSQELLTLEDYDQAFDKLKRLAVEKPANMKSTVRNVVDRSNLLYNPERGKFQLTLQGEQYVEAMGNPE